MALEATILPVLAELQNSALQNNADRITKSENSAYYPIAITSA